MRDADGNLHGAVAIAPMGMDGGGQVCTIEFADDGAAIITHDTGDPLILAAGSNEWRVLLRVGEGADDNVDAATYGYRPYPAHAWGADIHKTNSQIAYWISAGRLWRTRDGGDTAELMNWNNGQIDFQFGWVQGVARAHQGHIFIDPGSAAADVVAFSHKENGLVYTLDANAPTPTWTVHPNLDGGAPTYGHCIVCDRSSPVVNGQTQTVWCFRNGAGLYKSTTGIAGTFTFVPGGPYFCSQITVANGKVYCAGAAEDNSTLSIWDGASWSTAIDDYDAELYIISLAVDPANPLNMIGLYTAGPLYTSDDGGVTWIKRPEPGNKIGDTSEPTIAAEVPWLAWTNAKSRNALSCRIHPVTGDFWMAMGIGVLTLPDPFNIAEPSRYVDRSLGIRQLLSYGMVCTPNLGNVGINCHDRGGMNFTRANAKSQALRHALNDMGANEPLDIGTPLRHTSGQAMDHAPEDENFWAMVWLGNYDSGMAYTTNNGATDWTFVQKPLEVTAGGFGEMALCSKNDWVWVELGGKFNPARPRWSSDRGATWQDCLFAGSALSGIWHNTSYLRRTVLVNDKFNPNTVYAFFGGDPSELTGNEGVWKSTDKGHNFTKIRNGLIFGSNQDFYHFHLRLVPGRAGHMFAVMGDVNNYGTPPQIGGLRFTANDWSAELEVPGFWAVDDVAIGANLQGAAYPALYVRAHRDVAGTLVRGIWRALDFDPADGSASWEMIDDEPLGRPDVETLLAADFQYFGRVYATIPGGGGVVYDHEDLAIAT